MIAATSLSCPSATPERSGTLLDGRLSYTQFAHGYRTGIEPVLLAAALPLKAGESVLEAGCGAGAALLCAYARAGRIRGVGLEQDLPSVDLANRNFAANGAEAGTLVAFQARLPDISKTVRDLSLSANGRFDHVMANPPWHRPTGRPSPDGRRRLALQAEHTTPELWISTLTRWVLPRGTLTFILPAGIVDTACMALRAQNCGSIELYPLWPKTGREARLVILRAIHGGRASFRVRQGMVLHREDGAFTEAAERVLRDGLPLPDFT